MIDATLSIAAAAGQRWETIVIGAGPAGSAAAIRLATAGRRVLLIDRGGMPRPKVCGCCLSPLALDELARLRAFAADDPRPVPLAAVRLVAGGRAARLPLTGGTLSREALDTLLVARAIRAGAGWLPSASVVSIAEEGDGVRAHVRGTGDLLRAVCIEADHAVIATGLADAVRIEAAESSNMQPEARRPRRSVAASSRIGVGATLPPDASDLPTGELVMAVRSSGYVGIVRLEDGRIDIAAAVDAAGVTAAGGAEAALTVAVSDALRRCGLRFDAAALSTATVRGTPRLTHHAPVTAGRLGRIHRVGDAAGYVEPFTGEGMGWALAGARLLANAIIAGGPPLAVAATYRREHARLFGPHHARCRRVARAVRHPWLVGTAIRLARFAPNLVAGVVPLVVGAAAGSQEAAA